MGVATPVRRWKGGGLTQVSWSPDGQRVVASSVSAVFRVWETQSWTCETWTHASGRCKVGDQCAVGEWLMPHIQAIMWDGMGMRWDGMGMRWDGMGMRWDGLGMKVGWPGNEVGWPGNEVGWPGNEVGWPGNEVGWPGNEVGWPGNEVGWPGNEVGWHGNEVGWHGNEVGWPGPGMRWDGLGMKVGWPGNEVGWPGNEVGWHGNEVGWPGNEVGWPGNEVGWHGNEAANALIVTQLNVYDVILFTLYTRILIMPNRFPIPMFCCVQMSCYLGNQTHISLVWLWCCLGNGMYIPAWYTHWCWVTLVQLTTLQPEM